MFKPSKIILLFCLLHYGYLVSQTNVDFELTPSGSYTAANAVSGWSVSSRILNSTNGSCGTTAWQSGSPEFSIVTTPFTFPVIGGVGHSPLGGTQVARLNNSVANYMQTRITRTVSVNSSNCLLKIAFAGYWENGGAGQPCCLQPGFAFKMYNCSGIPLPCTSLSLSPGLGCQSAGLTYTMSGGLQSWANWQVKYFDLSIFIGTCVELEFTNSDCALDGNHSGTAFIDVAMTPQFMAPNYQLIYLSTPTNTTPILISYCNGSNIATLSGPLGYAQYQWVSPLTGFIPAPQGTMSTLTIQNPIPGTIYTLQLTTNSGCQGINTVQIVTTNVDILAIGASPTCINGSSGSATVLASGSSTGYNYQWINQSNSVVATSSVASNLSAGIYSVQVSATGNQACGTDGATLAINSAISNNVRFQSYCNNKAIIQVQGGTGHQWFNGTQPILGANSTSFTLSPVLPNTVITLTYLTSQNCLDSTRYNLIPTNPGTTYANNNNYVCSGANNGTTTLGISPTIGAPPFFRTFTVTNANTLTPSYTNTLFISHSNSVSIGGLSAGQYSINAFDGVCEFSNTFTVNAFSFDYQMANNNANICSGGNTISGVVFSTSISPGQYTYSWQPTTFLLPGTQMMQSTIITPTVASGQSTSIVYTMVVTPTVVNCPLTKTLGINVFNNVPATIATPTSGLCQNSTSNFTLATFPQGGVFSGNPNISTNGILTPPYVNMGVNTFSFQPNLLCLSPSTATFLVHGPALDISGTDTICKNQSTLLNALGADSYTWLPQFSNSSQITVNPNTTSTYTLEGLDNASGCKSTLVKTVKVFIEPVISAQPSSQICLGDTVILNASGALTYTWNNVITVNSLTVIPNATAIYTLNSSSIPFCNYTKTIEVKVNPKPQINISGYTSVCKGERIVLIANGNAQLYSWNNSHVYSPGMSLLQLTSAQQVTFSVKGSDTINNCSSTKIVTVTINNCYVGIEEVTDYDLVKIYPNPFSQKLTISNNSPSTLKLFNQLGQLIISKKLELQIETLDLEQLEDGIYILQLDNPNQRFSKRIVKQSQ